VALKAAAAPVVSADEEPAAPEDGLKLVPAAISIAVGLAVRFLVPIPDTLSVQVR
jgi:hypothetical protein